MLIRGLERPAAPVASRFVIADCDGKVAIGFFTDVAGGGNMQNR